MKVAFVTDNDINSGIWKQNYALINWLKEKWVDIDLISLYIPSRYKWEPKWKYIKGNIHNTYYLSLLYWVIYAFPKELPKLLREGKYTHVILGHQFLGYLYSSLSKIDIKISIIVHDLCLLYKKEKNIWDILYTKLLMRNLGKFKNLVFISEFTKNDYMKYYGSLENKNYAIIYQWIDQKKINNKIKEHLVEKYNLKDKIIFMNVWSEDPRKNIITYLKIAKYYKENKDLLFVRVWKPSKESNDYINIHELKNVLYLSWLSDEELFALYNLSKATISTSLFEWYWRQIFEWYLYGNYVITSNVSDVKKIFNWDNSVYIIDDPYSAEKYCDIINQILSEWECLNKMKEIPDITIETENYYKFLNSIV